MAHQSLVRLRAERAMTSPAFRPAHELAVEVAARRLSPVDLLDECLARIERLEPSLHAFVSVNAGNARLAAEAAEPLDQDVRPRVRAGAAISSRDYLVALAERERMKASFSAAIEGIDALLTPTAVTAALPVASIDQNTTPAVFTRWVNFLDFCAAAVPNGFIPDGLPTSLQIVCRAQAETLALRIGHAYQTAHDWHLRVPPMAL
jgi:Asp-tRNA(Asn)/Glu-tRNA(Gln) amidotransferase A subunit family amidase